MKIKKTYSKNCWLVVSNCVIKQFDDELYFPADVAIELGYSVLSHWIEERDV